MLRAFMLPFVLAATPELDAAREAFKHLDCPAALKAASAAEATKTLDPDELEETWWIQARCSLSAGNRRGADEALHKLLRDNPSFSADSESPKVKDAVNAARATLYPEGFVALEPLVSTVARERFRLVDPWRQVSSVVLRSRSLASAPFEASPLELTKRVVVVDQPSIAGRQWFLEARSDANVVVASVASESAPRGTTLVPVEKAVEAPAPVVPELKLKPNQTVGIGLGVGAVVSAAIGAGLMAGAGALNAKAPMEVFGSDVRRLVDAANLQAGLAMALFTTASVLTLLALTIGLK